MRSIKVSDLKPGYSMFGNTAACWNDEVHIVSPRSSMSLCGLPRNSVVKGKLILSNNWAKIKGFTLIKCPECVAIYKKEVSKEITVEEFDSILMDIVSEMSPLALFNITGVSELISEALNNDILKEWKDRQS